MSANNSIANLFVTLDEPHLTVMIAILKYFDKPDASGRLYASDITKLGEFNVNLGIVRSSLRHLLDLQLIDQHSSGNDSINGIHVDHYYEFTVAGGEYAYKLIRDASESKTNTFANGYEPIALTSDTPDLQIAVDAITEVIEGVRGNNGLEEIKRSSVLSGLDAGIRILQSLAPTRNQIDATLLAPLRWLITIFGKAGLGEIAKIAVQSVLKLFGF